VTRHVLHGRSEDELLWFRRRGFLQAAAAWTAAGGWAAAHAQQRGNVVELQGDVLLNGQRLRPGQSVQTSDRLETGPDSQLLFVMGNAAFFVRQNSRLAMERGATLSSVSVLRLLAGGVVGAWSRGSHRQIVLPALTAGIRGTGTYAEVEPGGRSYLCNCYGIVEISSGRERVTSSAQYHQSFWGEAEPVNGRLLTPAPAINHSDEEVEKLAALVNERTAWQVLGRKGARDGSGFIDSQPQPHLLAR
jgi:hypothetical protein